MTEPRDDSLDRLLRQTLRQTPGAGATPSCLDAETMAAWMDGGLSGVALAAAEAHAASCPHCRALAAVMARSETAEPHPAEVSSSAAAGPRARRSWPWLVPLAAAALIAMAIWIPRRGEQPAQESTIASAPPTETAPQLPPSGSIGERRQPPPTQQDARAAAKETRPATAENARSDQADSRRETAAAGPPAASADARATPPPPSAAPSLPPATPIPPPAASPPPPAPPTPVAAAPEPVVTPAPFVTPAPNAGAPRPAFRTGLETVIAEFQSPDVSAQAAPIGAAAGRGPAGGGAGTGVGTGAGTGTGAGIGPGAGTAVGGVAGGRGGGGRGGAAARGGSAGGPAQPSASQPIRWRVLASGIVERSSPPGAPWEPITIEPAGARVTNGAAPNPLVCWLVGRNGVVFLTVDGRSFTRITFPEAVDLASVRATSAREAIVTTTDTRTFVTTDGGRTWSRE